MKQLYFILGLLLTGFTAVAQIPAGYYDSAISTGYALKTELKAIIDNTNNGLSPEYLSIDNGYGALYTTFANSDVDLYFENNGTLLDMYSENPTGADAYEYTYGTNQDSGTGGTAEGQFYNREHIVPQSVFGGASPMKNDAHFVVPSDKYVNAQRGNFPFGVVVAPNLTTTNGSKRGNNLNSGYSAGYTGVVFEPIDEFKGDIARMFFYFVTRYESNMTGYSYDMFNGSSDQCFDNTFFSIMYQWHTQDPVSTREIDRNNAIFTAQNNRNPFIDNPSYVSDIWQGLLSVEEFTQDQVQIFPNPIKDNSFTIKVKTDLNYVIYDVLGKRVLAGQVSAQNNLVNVSILSKGVYILKLQNKTSSITKKLIKQ